MRESCTQMEMLHLQARRELELGGWQSDWTIPFNQVKAEFNEHEKQWIKDTAKYRCVRDKEDHFCNTPAEVWEWIGKSWAPYQVHLREDDTMHDEFIPF